MPRLVPIPPVPVPAALVRRLLAVAACLLPLGLAVLHAAPAGAQALVGPPVNCQELRDQGYLVSLSDRDLTGGDETRFCLVARPEEDTFVGYLANIATLDSFRDAKRLYAGALVGGGYDVCRVGVWLPLNREGGPQLGLSAADQLDVPFVCAPRIVARDEGAVEWIGRVQEMLTPLAERTHRDLGVTPHRPLTVDLYTDTAAFVAAAQVAGRAAGQPIDAEAAARIARGGRSLTVLTPTRGVFMLLNLTRAPGPEMVRGRLAHEYVHFLQSAVAGTLVAYPVWFLEGLAEFQMERLTGADAHYRADAARRDRDGGAPRLPDLVTPDAWAAAEARAGSDAVYGRAESAVAFITERWGAAAAVKLLTAASDIDPGRFDRVLGDVTGTDLAGLDQSLSAWLRTLGGRVTFYNDSPLAHRLLLADGRAIDIPACPTCAFLRPADACREDGRPSLRLELPAGEYDILQVVPDDRIHFPDTPLHLRIDPGAALTRCLALRVA